jgi:hypothetical protein
MKKLERDVHGVPLWLMCEYLTALGGEARGENQVVGEGWQARFEKVEPFRIGSLSVGRARLEIEGDEQAIEALMPSLELKLMRGGG